VYTPRRYALQLLSPSSGTRPSNKSSTDLRSVHTISRRHDPASSPLLVTEKGGKDSSRQGGQLGQRINRAQGHITPFVVHHSGMRKGKRLRTWSETRALCNKEMVEDLMYIKEQDLGNLVF